MSDESATPASPATETYRGPRPASDRRARGPLRRGDQLGRYVVLDQVGAGGMGVVYTAYDPELNRRIALKVLQAETEASRHGEEAGRRLLREAQAVARVVHPNVVTIHDVGTVGSRVFLAMEYVEGQDLAAAVEALGDGAEAAESRRRVLELFLDAGRGLAAVHAAGLAHRDFKPSNVRVGADGRVRVVDFGLALYAGDGSAGGERGDALPLRESSDSALLDSPLTREGEIFGTPRYMAPEQHLGQRADAKSDQFSFCVALYEALFGRHPFAASKARDLVRLARRGLPPEGPEPAAREVARLRPVLARGLAFDPADRYPDLAALLGELEAAGLGSRRRRRHLAAAGLGLLAVVAVVAAWQLGRTPPCQGARHKLDGVWDAGRRSAVAGAFPGAAWAATSRVLDRYAGAWQASYLEACEATHLRGEQSSELLDLRMACLEDRRQELRALTELFLEPTPELVGNAAAAASNLSPLAPCSDAERLRAPIQPPAEDPRTTRDLVEVRRRLAEIRALRAAARPAEALEGLRPALDLAGALGYAPAAAEARLEEADLLIDLGRYQPAAGAYREAMYRADEGRHDEVRARSLLGLVWAEKNRGRAAAAAMWSEQARAVIRRTGDQPDLLMRWYQAAAQVALARWDAETALEMATTAVELSRRVHGPEHLHTGVYLSAVASAHSIAFRFDEALAVAEQAADIQRRVLGERHPTVGRIERNMALQEIMLGRFEAARERLLGCLDKARDLRDNHLVSVYSDLGVTEARLGLEAEAELHLRAAYDLAVELHGEDSRRVAEINNYLADARLELGDPEGAKPYLRRALELLAGEPASSAEKVAPSLNMALAHARTGDYAAAERLLDSVGASLAPDAFWTWVVERIGGLVAAGRGRSHEAVQLLGSALARLEALASASPIDVHWLRLDLARATWAAGDGPRARGLAAGARDFFAAEGRAGARGAEQADDLIARIDAAGSR